MKHFIIILCLTFMGAIDMLAQGSSVVFDDYVSDEFKNVVNEVPHYREIKSGSKFVVSYEGNWPAEMMGAFEYAVKIWEEVLPMTMPLNLKAKIETKASRRNVISQTAINEFSGYPHSQVKAVLLKEYHKGFQTRFYDTIQDTAIFAQPDLYISYYSDKLDEFDFSLDGQPSPDKYDFVTVVLRDIAMGLGFTTSLSADINKERIKDKDSSSHPFERLILSQLDSDPYVAYQMATKGSVKIPVYGQEITLYAYAPNTWVNGQSLRFLIPDDNPISKLLAYDFGKGYVMHDLTGIDWDLLFTWALDWYADSPSGTANVSGSYEWSGTSEDILPFRGNVNLTSRSSADRNGDIVQSPPNSEDDLPYENTGSYSTRATDFDLPISQYCMKYDSFSPEGPQKGMTSISVLKKDGSWDCVLTSRYLPSNLKIEDLKLNYDESEYARGTTGGLRYRITDCSVKSSWYGGTFDYDTKYYTRDFTPQKALIKYDSRTATPAKAKSRGIAIDDWFVDVNVGIANIEGTTRVIVEQLDEGEELPFQYEVEDFRKGYFTANLDRECDTQLTVICYNDNGYQRSNTITIPAIGYSSSNGNITLQNYGQYVQIKGLSEQFLSSGDWTYAIQNLTANTVVRKTSPLRSNQIDIADLPSGVYALTLTDNSGQRMKSMKFVKR